MRPVCELALLAVFAIPVLLIGAAEFCLVAAGVEPVGIVYPRGIEGSGGRRGGKSHHGEVWLGRAGAVACEIAVT